jgi:hypothetical protein
MENTYISELLAGTEQGFYLALDLGGTNFRSVIFRPVLRNQIILFAETGAASKCINL